MHHFLAGIVGCVFLIPGVSCVRNNDQAHLFTPEHFTIFSKLCGCTALLLSLHSHHAALHEKNENADTLTGIAESLVSPTQHYKSLTEGGRVRILEKETQWLVQRELKLGQISRAGVILMPLPILSVLFRHHVLWALSSATGKLCL